MMTIELLKRVKGSTRLLTSNVSGAAFVCLVLTGCAYDSFHYADQDPFDYHANSAVVQTIPSTNIHRVASGDTLFSIAFSYGLDYRTVAENNGIEPPYVIYPNQKIRLKGSAKQLAKAAPATIKDEPETKKKVSAPVSKAVTKKTTPKVNSSPKVVSTVKAPVKKVSDWRWPVSGAVTKSFSNAGVSSKGIDIKGQDAEHVKAAADGVVVYAGNGLIGYGNLVIVKHNDVYLSAYAYNERILVKEKQTVRVGDSLAVIGGKGAERPLLHFEVRRDGRPIDPLKVLPKQ